MYDNFFHVYFSPLSLHCLPYNFTPTSLLVPHSKPLFRNCILSLLSISPLSTITPYYPPFHYHPLLLSPIPLWPSPTIIPSIITSYVYHPLPLSTSSAITIFHYHPLPLSFTITPFCYHPLPLSPPSAITPFHQTSSLYPQ